ncbi:MAG: hypothetical protein ACXWJM_00165 [Ramlibacter sp.]
MPAMAWVHKLLFPAGRVADAAADDGHPPQEAEFASLRYEMTLAVQQCGDVHSHRAVEKIRRAASPMDLWLLRPEVYLYLAQDLGQCEANARLNALMPLFGRCVPEAPAGQARHNAPHEQPLH